MFPLQELLGKLHRFLVAILVIRLFQHAPFKLTRETLQAIVRMSLGCRNLLVPGIPVGAPVPRVIELLQLEFVPLIGRIEPGHMMQNLARTRHVVAILFEICRNRIHARQRGTPVLVVVINPRGGRAHAREQRRPRRIAQRGRAVRIGKQNSPFRQAINIRRTHSRVALQATDPVVHIVHGKEEDIGF